MVWVHAASRGGIGRPDTQNGFPWRRLSMHKSVAALLAVALYLGFQVTASAQWTWTPETKRWINVKRLPKETAELQLEYARSVALEGDYKKALREADKFDDYYADSPLSDQNQFLRGDVRLQQGKLELAAKEYQQVVSKHPDSAMFNEVIAKQYEIGDHFYDKGQKREQRPFGLFAKAPYKKAIDVYGMVIENQPFTPAAAQAQYKLGLCHFAREEYVEAAYEYRRVVEDYAQSDWVDEASYGLAETYYTSSLPADYDQTPSKLAIDAIDEFKVRFPADQRVAELDQKRSEMRERIARQRLNTAQFYEKRRDFTAARLYYEVVVEQFGDTSAAEKAREWLAANPLNTDDPSAFIFPETKKGS
jgi:outer membrane protein assembly factor BamD